MLQYLTKCSKGVGEVVVIDIAQIGMRTRAVTAEETGGEKRRKVGNGELRLRSPTLVQITTEGDIRDRWAAAPSLCCDYVLASCCSSNGSVEELQFTDLEVIVETGTNARYNLDTTASKRRRELKAGSGEQQMIRAMPSTVSNSRRTVPVEKMPPAAELEEFFASAEADLHKRFKDKYNYDVVKDTPLEGRLEWVPVKMVKDP